MKQEMIQKSTPRAGALARLLMTALIAFTSLAACHNELADDRLNPNDAATRTVTLSVSMPADGTQTRVTYDGDFTLKWEESDQLIVYNQPTNPGEPLGTPLGTLTIEKNSISTDGISAKFTGDVAPATGKYSLRYATAGTTAQAPAPDTTPGTTPAQVQPGNANTDHLRSLLGLSADNVTSLTDPITLTLDAAILKLGINNLTAEQITDLGTLKSLQWKSEITSGLAGTATHTMTLGLDGVTPDATGSITAYIAFRPAEMSLTRGGTFSITLTGANDTQYIATTSATNGKTYEPGQRYTVVMGNGDGELPLHSRRVKGDGTAPLDTIGKFNAQSPEWVISGGGTAEKDAAVLTNVKEALDALPAGTNTIELTLTEVTELPGSAFSGINSTVLASIDLPEATTIGESAFNDCSVLTSVNLPKATTIGKQAFQSCTALTSIDLSKAKTIGQEAFYNCTALTSIDLPEATSIGNRAFYECRALATVKLPAATSIGNRAFYSCYSLSSLSLPAVTNIGENTFSKCTALTRLELTAAGAITLDANAFYEFPSSACTLKLNPDKQIGGKGTPTVAGGNLWGPTNPATVAWKPILFPGINLPPIEDDNNPY